MYVFQVKVEGLRDSMYCVSCEAMAAQLEALVEKTEDFTDSAYTSHEQRETIIQLCQITRQETKQLINTWRHAVRHIHALGIVPTSYSPHDLSLIWWWQQGGKLHKLHPRYIKAKFSLGLYICHSRLCCAECEGCSACLTSCGVTVPEPHTLGKISPAVQIYRFSFIPASCLWFLE